VRQRCRRRWFPRRSGDDRRDLGSRPVSLNYLYPDRAADFEARAEEQAVSRIYAGIHWRFDAVSLEGGRRISALVIDRVKGDRVGRQA
jgi:hypothetical protein